LPAPERFPTRPRQAALNKVRENKVRMSSRLVTKIKDIKGIPGKHKRVLEAWAAFANNDGTNIYPSKEKVAQKATISRWTVYKNTEDLIRAGLLVQATAHTCKIKSCNKGGTHFTGQWGKYTVVYNINPLALQNSQTYLLLKQPKECVAKQPKESVAKGDATLSIEQTPAPLASLTPLSEDQTRSALTGGTYSPTYSLTRSSGNGEKNTPASGLLPNQEPNPYAVELLRALKPNLSDQRRAELIPVCEEIIALVPDHMDAFDLLAWNHAHEQGEFSIRGSQQYLAALKSPDCNLVNNYDTHPFEDCPVCKKAGILRWADAVATLEKDKRDRAEFAARKVRWEGYVWDRLTEEERLAFRELRDGFGADELNAAATARGWKGGLLSLAAAGRTVIAAGRSVTLEEFVEIMDDVEGAWRIRNYETGKVIVKGSYS
jgi:hypothetical protein